MEKKTESVKVDVTTLKLLKELKEKEGINMSTAITLAVKEKYGDKIEENNEPHENKIVIKENFDN